MLGSRHVCRMLRVVQEVLWGQCSRQKTRGPRRRAAGSIWLCRGERALGLLTVSEPSLRVTLWSVAWGKGAAVRASGSQQALFSGMAAQGRVHRANCPHRAPQPGPTTLTPVPPLSLTPLQLPMCSGLCPVLPVPLPEGPSLGRPDLANKNTVNLGKLELPINELSLFNPIFISLKKTC